MTHLIHARRAPASTVNAGHTRQGEGFANLQARSLSPISTLIISACREFGTRHVLAEAVVVPLALAGLFIAGGMLS